MQQIRNNRAQSVTVRVYQKGELRHRVIPGGCVLDVDRLASGQTDALVRRGIITVTNVPGAQPVQSTAQPPAPLPLLSEPDTQTSDRRKRKPRGEYRPAPENDNTEDDG